MVANVFSEYFYYFYYAACTRTYIPLEEATGISTGKYD